jgi:PAS domain S-box-containing protein
MSKKEELSTQDDISELKYNQRFLSTLISNLPGYIYRCHEEDGEWCTQFASEGIYELTGYSSADFLKGGKLSYGSLVYEEDTNIVRDVVKKAINDQGPYQINYRIRTADNKIKWVWEQGRGIYDDNGNLLATEGYIIDITEKKLAEEEIIKRNNELSILNKIGQSISKLAEPEQIYDIVLTMIDKLFDINNIFIALHDKSSNTISFPVYRVNGKSFEKPEREFKNGLTEYVLRSGKPLFINNNKEKIYKQLNITQIDKPAKSVLSVPMTAGDNVLGVITLQDYEHENVYSKEQLQLLLTIASQIGIAIENSRLYNEIQNELEERKIIESQIKKSLKEKEILLQEVHHRVKNNLQIMSSLLRLQSSYIQDKKVLDIFKESENRIKSMAIVHNKLHQTHDYEKIDAEDYINSLVENLRSTYALMAARIKFKTHIQRLSINIETAIPCGLIINELVSNAIKYAFPDRNGNVTIYLNRNTDMLFNLKVEDDGIGLPENFSAMKDESLGLKLVNMLVEQLNGKLEINTKKPTSFNIHFSEVVYKSRT